MILENLKDKNIILASKSPRRQELLKGLELDFEIRTKTVDEVFPKTLKRESISIFLSQLKAEAFLDELTENDILITSDTTVHLGEQLLEKPKDSQDAIQMLKQLSGQTHAVITAVTLSSKNKQKSFFQETQVSFARLSDLEIEHYVKNYEPFDKAGSYGVQELMGYIGIEKLDGCYYNVMGLPLQMLYNELKSFC